MIVRRFAVAVLAATLAVSACKGDPPPAPAPPMQNQDSLNAYNDSVAAARAEERRLAALREAEAAEAAALARRIDAARATLLEMVFFDYDVSAVRSDQESLLRRKAEILRASPQVQLRISGHADERGSTEYNLALGNQRASAVREFLTGFGLSSSRFSIVSFGEDRPRNMGSNESAWAQNRRGEFEITAGSNAINPAN